MAAKQTKDISQAKVLNYQPFGSLSETIIKTTKPYGLFNRLFKWNYGFPSRVPVFEAHNKALESGDTDAFLKNKLNEYGNKLAFPNGSELKEYDDRFALEYKSRVLQVYRASDAVLYYDRDLAGPAGPEFAQELPAEQAAALKAHAQLVDLGFKSDNDTYARYLGADYTVAIRDEGNGAAPEVLRTETKAMYGFVLDGLPVFGAGGKMQCSYVRNNLEMSEMLSFWRQPTEGLDGKPRVLNTRKLIGPVCALFKLAWRKRFFRIVLLHWARLRITGFQLGYFAAPPFIVQKNYIPVYRIRGSIKPRKEEAYEFAYYVPAVRFSTQEKLAIGWPFNSGAIIE